MVDEEKQWYDLVKYNFRDPTPETTEVLETVRGLGHAEHMVDVLNERLTPEDKAAGFSVYLRKGSKPAGVDLRRHRKPPDTRPNRRR